MPGKGGREVPKDAYEGPKQDQARKPADADAETPVLSAAPNPADTDYEALFMKDVNQRAHDAELQALASLALIRSYRSESGMMMMDMERDLTLSPRVVDRHLREEQILDSIKKENQKKK